MTNSERKRWAWHVARNEKKRKLYTLLVGKPEGKRPLGRPTRKRVDNIKTDLRSVDMGCTDLTHDIDHCRALMNTTMERRAL
jgi:hypothetical protein